VAERTRSNPDAPGPPGLINSDPMRRAGSVAGSRIMATANVGPVGAAQSIGTVTVAQSKVFSHFDHVGFCW
jgi:hypothetical protein